MCAGCCCYFRPSKPHSGTLCTPFSHSLHFRKNILYMERKILISAPRHIQTTKILRKFLLLVAPVNWMYHTALNFKWVLNLQEVFLNCKCAENFKWITGGKSCAVGFTTMRVTHIATASTEMQKNSSLPNLSLTVSTSRPQKLLKIRMLIQRVNRY